MDSTAHIDVRDVSKHFDAGKSSRRDDRIHALDKVSFQVKKGEFVSLVGPSGCGKSTLLRLISGLISPSSGEIRVGDQRVIRPIPVGFVFQTPALLPWRSVLGNVLMSASLAGRRTRDYRDRARELLSLVGLNGFEARSPNQLSGGMQQRVALCRALLLDPELLLMDEPFGALDAMTRDEMNAELLRIWSSGAAHKTVVFVTHSIAEAVFLSDRIVVMSARPGRVAQETHSVLARPRTEAMKGTSEFASQTQDIYALLHRRTGEGSTRTPGGAQMAVGH
jgi:NitT/TauT family transport system ATP-binding protein